MTGIRGRLAAMGLAGMVGCVMLAGCGGSGFDSASGHFGGTLTVLQDGDVFSLDPGQSYDSNGYAVIDATQRRLYRWRDGSQLDGVQPDLASGMPVVSSDGKTVTVHLRRGVMFGPPVDAEVTAADVKYAFERAFSRVVANPYAQAYFGDIAGAPRTLTRVPEPISGIATPNPFTIEFHLTRPTGGFLSEALVLPISTPVPEQYARPFDRHDPSTYFDHVVSSGPYMIANNRQGKLTGYQPNVSILLVRNPDWRRSTDFRKAYLNRILIRETATNSTLASQQTLDGQNSVSLLGIPPTVLQSALADQRSQILAESTPGWQAIALNTRVGPLRKLDVRRAIVAAFNRTGYDTLSGGPIGAGPLQTHYLAPGIPGFSEAGGMAGPALDFMSHPRGDLTLARQYLIKAGYRSGRVGATLDLVTTDDPLSERQAQFIKAQLGPLGLDVHIRIVTVSAYENDCYTPKAEPALCGITWLADFGDGEAMLQVNFDGAAIQPTNNYNTSLLNDPAVNAAMARADLLPVGSARDAAWAQIDDMITADAPDIPTFYQVNPYPESRNVHGVVNSQEGYDYSETYLR